MRDAVRIARDARTRRRTSSKRRERGSRRETALAELSSVLVRSFQEADVSSSVRGGAKMNARVVVSEELRSVRNSDRLANALSSLTSLK